MLVRQHAAYAGPQPVILFDLGGVLIDNHMFSELKRLMNTDKTEPELIEMWLKNPVAREFELGRCSISDFTHSIVREFELPLSPESFLVV